MNNDSLRVAMGNYGPRAPNSQSEPSHRTAGPAQPAADEKGDVTLGVRQVEHVYGTRRVLALDRLDFAPGTTTALVGPNGSGKSTLLRILACLEPPTRGTIILDSRPLDNAAARQAARRAITLVEQRPLLFRGSVRGNLLYALGLHGIRGAEAERRSAAALERIGVAALAGRGARGLSEGETQKVAIARSLALQPRVLLLDEPVSAADAASAGQLYRVLEEEKARGVTLCFASHQLENAYRWADRLLALTDGQLSPVTPENLFRVVIPPGEGARRVRAGPLDLLIVTDRTGPAIVAIPPDDIVVSTSPLHSSARNEFPGSVRRIAEDGRGGVTLTVDVGVDLAVRITRSALEDLHLTLGAPVVLSIKTMAVRVF